MLFSGLSDSVGLLVSAQRQRSGHTHCEPVWVARNNGKRMKAIRTDNDGARADLTEALEINPYFDPIDAITLQQTLDALGDNG